MSRRNTREAILDTALALFNEHGEGRVSTNLIALELEISPGNLYYHFRHKGDIVEALFARHETAMNELLAVHGTPGLDPEDTWFYLHHLFELIGAHRFLYRDFSDVTARNRKLNKRFKALLELQAVSIRSLTDSLSQAGILQANPAEQAALIRNVLLITTCWLSFAELLAPLAGHGPPLAVWQVLSLFVPLLKEPERSQLEALALQYLKS